MTTNDSIDDRLRESLGALSKPVETGEEPSLVHRALAEVESGSQRTRSHGPSDAPRKPWHRRIPGGLGSLVVAALALVVIVGVFVPHLGSSRRVAIGERQENDAMDVPILEQPVQTLGLDGRVLQPGERKYAFNALPVPTPSSAPAPMAAMAKSAEAGALADAAKDSARADDQPRIIIRTGNCEIRVEDVEAGRARIESLIRADLGEYIEDASVQLDQDRPTATITVRIDSARFDEFVKALEGVGTLRSLSVNASDATDQVIDLEARLRNERRIEDEVLGLLENRADAPLDDIVRVRRELAEVRESIERMEAQRKAMIGRAELSTVRITLVGPEPALSSVDQDAPTFGRRMRTAIADGWRACTDSVTWLAEVLIAGLVWWILLGIAIWYAVRRWRFTRSWR